MEGDAGPQLAVYDSFGCGNAPYYQYQFLPGKGSETIDEAKQTGLSGMLNLNFDTSCSPTREHRFRMGLELRSPQKCGGWEGFSYLGNSNTEIGSNCGSRDQGAAKVFSPSDLRRNCARSKPLISVSDSQHLSNSCGAEPKRKQSLFQNGSPTNRISSIDGEESGDEDTETLRLKLCPGSYSYTEDLTNGSRNSKRYRPASPGSQSPACQVDDCSADLKHAKDYHKRHKVCEMHSKAAKSLVHGLLQRFCQQCSRFHPLNEFDEGKRSCRRRLAGHNKRRRKPHPEGAPTGAPSSDGFRSSELLSIVAILSQIQSNAKEKEQDSALQGVKKTNLSLPMCTPLIRDAIPAVCSLDSMRPSSPQTLREVSHSDPDSQTGFLARLARSSPEELSVVLQNGLEVPDSLNQGRVQQPETSPPVSCNEQGVHPLFSSGFKNSEGLRKASNGSEEQSDLQSTNLLAVLERSSRNNDCADPAELSSRERVTRQYIGPASMNGVEGDHEPVYGSNLTAFPAEKEFFPPESGIRLRNETTSRMNGAPHNSESMERLLSVDECDNPTALHGISRSSVLDKRNWLLSESSESGSDQSPASSSSDWQELTGRILFKLFDKNPGDIPQNAKVEIQQWLSLTPFCVETYMRPGCILLTAFLTMPRYNWKELLANLRESLERLLMCSRCDLWTKGRIFVQAEQQRAFILDGKVRKIRHLTSVNSPILKSVRPLAIVAGEEVTLCIRGHNFVPQAKIVCVYHGKYVLHEIPLAETGDASACSYSGSFKKGATDEQVQRVCFPGGPANVFGRCFIEAEHNLTGNMLPVIVADTAICAELRSLEKELDLFSLSTQNHEDVFAANEIYVLEEQAMNFLHELGWVFQNCYPLTSLDREPFRQFNLSRFQALLKYAVSHDWCAVVKKLLDLLFTIGLKESDGTLEEVLQILSELKLIHQAVKRRCRLMVELLLQYVPVGDVQMCQSIFSPAMEGPAGLTPLHVAASISNAEGIVDALTNDPGEVGLHAWKDALDYSGRTPEWHAFNSGNMSYAQLVDEKLKIRQSDCVRITVGDAPHKDVNISVMEFKENTLRTKESMDRNAMMVNLPRFLSRGQISFTPPGRRCRTQHVHHRVGGVYKPFVMMLVAIATLCAAVALFLKSPPRLSSISYSLKWEGILYGTS